MQITRQIVNSLQLAAGIVQTANHQMAEHRVAERRIAHAVIERAEDQLRPDDLNLAVLYGCKILFETIVRFRQARKHWTGKGVEVIPFLTFQLKKFMLGMADAKTLHDTLLPVPCLDNHLDTCAS